MKESSNIYHSQKELWKKYPNKHNLSQREFVFVLRTFFELLGYNMVNHGTVYRLPFGLSTLGVFKMPYIGRGIFDYQLYKETGIKRYKRNDHSSQFAGRVMWQNNWPRFKIPMPGYAFSFKPCRALARYLASQIKNNNTINKYYDY